MQSEQIWSRPARSRCSTDAGQASRLLHATPATAIASRATSPAEAAVVRLAPVGPRSPVSLDDALGWSSGLRGPEVKALERDLVARRESAAHGLKPGADRGAAPDQEEVRKGADHEAGEGENLRHRVQSMT